MTAATTTLADNNITAGLQRFPLWPGLFPGTSERETKRSFEWYIVSPALGQTIKDVPSEKGIEEQERAEIPTARKQPVGGIYIDRSAHLLLTGDRLSLYEKLTAIIVTKALTSGIRIKEIRLSLFRDAEENTREIVYEITVFANPAQAFAYWDTIGLSIDAWRERLHPRIQDELATLWSFRVKWHTNGGG